MEFSVFDITQVLFNVGWILPGRSKAVGVKADVQVVVTASFAAQASVAVKTKMEVIMAKTKKLLSEHYSDNASS